MRRSLEAAREQPGPPDPGGYRSRLLTVGQALAAVGAVDLVTLEEILVDFNLAMSVRQLAEPGAGQGPGQGPGQPGRAARTARLVTQSQSIHQVPLPWAVRMRLGQSPGGGRTADLPGRRRKARRREARRREARRRNRAGRGSRRPVRPGRADGAVPRRGHQRRVVPDGVRATGAGPRFFAVWNLRTPALQDATLIPLPAFTVTDDRGTRYRLAFTPATDSGWTTEIGLRPAPPPGTRWLDVTAPGSKPVRVALDLACPERAPASEVNLSPGELLLVMLAERLLTAVPDFPRTRSRQVTRVAPLALRAMAAGLGDIVAALEAADVLSPLSPVPGPAGHAVRQPGPPRARDHGAACPPAAGALAQRAGPLPAPEARPGPAARRLRGHDRRPARTGRHRADPAGPASHRGGLGPAHAGPGPAAGAHAGTQLGPLGVDLAMPLSIWLRDSGGRWHAARPATGPGRAPGRRVHHAAAAGAAADPRHALGRDAGRGQSAEVRTTVPLRWGFPL